MMGEKRFQECNILGKTWRYRWYLLLPFQWVWFRYVKPMSVIETEFNEEKGYICDTDRRWKPSGKNLWKILVGSAQGKMKWHWTYEEVMARLRVRK
jgi:hypothetical protein